VFTNFDIKNLKFEKNILLYFEKIANNMYKIFLISVLSFLFLSCTYNIESKSFDPFETNQLTKNEIDSEINIRNKKIVYLENQIQILKNINLKASYHNRDIAKDSNPSEFLILKNEDTIQRYKLLIRKFQGEIRILNRLSFD